MAEEKDKGARTLDVQIAELHNAVKELHAKVDTLQVGRIQCFECSCGPCAECWGCRVCSVCSACRVCKICKVCAECSCGPCAAG